MTIEFTAIPTSVARSYQAGGVDAYGNLPEQSISSGPGCPCRHCLKNIPQGNEMLVLAHRPFPELQPYAETGPIFLCAAKCQRGGGSEALPEVLQADHYILRGYGPDDRIVYGTGQVTETNNIPEVASKILSDPQVKYVHVRSASNNCFSSRIDLSR